MDDRSIGDNSALLQVLEHFEDWMLDSVTNSRAVDTVRRVTDPLDNLIIQYARQIDEVVSESLLYNSLFWVPSDSVEVNLVVNEEVASRFERINRVLASSRFLQFINRL